jgi:transcriptional antiterminator RfaH
MSKPAPGFYFRLPWRARRDRLTLSDGERWYLVQSIARREANAEFQLCAQDFRVFLPSFTKTVRHARNFRLVRAPVFTGYLFVILDLERDQWRSINGTLGVSRVVMSDGRPSPVPAGLVESMLDRTDAAGETSLTYGFQSGDAVRLLGGPFDQLLGTLDRLDAGGRVRVLLEIMGGIVPVMLDLEALEPASRGQA